MGLVGWQKDKVEGKRRGNANPAAGPQKDGVNSVLRGRIFLFHKEATDRKTQKTEKVAPLPLWRKCLEAVDGFPD